MSLGVENYRVLYNGNGSTTSFAITQTFDDNDEIVVILRDTSVSPPTETIQVEGDDYDIVSTNVVMDVAPPSTAKLGIFRVVDLEQELNLIGSGALFVESLEDQLDYITKAIQQLDGGIKRAIKVARTAPTAQLDFPIEEDFTAGATIVVNDDADGIVMGPTVAEVEGWKDDAEAAAAAAATSQTAAANSASSAATQASNAAASASDASDFADDAAASATSASTSASDAATSAAAAAAAAAGAVAGKQDGPLTGDVTTASTSLPATTIANDAVSNAKMANMATQTIKGRTTAGTGDPEDLTATQATAILNNMVGDSGSGGTKGLVPAPASGDAAAAKFLKADATWATAGVSAHSALSGLTSGDDHTQYFKIAGRSGGQTADGDTASGGNLTLSSTAHATKGKILIGVISIAIDEANTRLGLGTTSPTHRLHVKNTTDSYTETIGISNGSSNEYNFYVSPGSIFYLRNHTQSLAYFQANSSGQVSLAGADVTTGKAVRIKNQATKTTDITVSIEKLTSQTAEFMQFTDTDGSTVLAKIDVAGKGFFSNIRDTAFSAAGVVTNNSSGDFSSVAPGTSGNVLTSNGSAWVSSAGASITARSVLSKSADYTVLTGDFNGSKQLIIFCSAALTLTLPAASNSGYDLIVKNTGTGTVNIVRAGSDTIDGDTALSLGTQYQSAMLIADGGTSWGIVG